jgi:hypothetical protein
LTKKKKRPYAENLSSMKHREFFVYILLTRVGPLNLSFNALVEALAEAGR